MIKVAQNISGVREKMQNRILWIYLPMDMRLYRFYLQNVDFETLTVGDSFYLSEPNTVNQLTKVLRAQIGDGCILFNEISEYRFEIQDISKKELRLKVAAKLKKLVPEKKVILIQSLIKKDKFEWVAQKVTELGVSEIIPVLSERSEKKSVDILRLQKIVQEAVEQSGWGRVPHVQSISTLAESIAALQKRGVSVYILDKDGDDIPADTEEVALCIGPEGGWGTLDKKVFADHGVKTLSLGRSTLRSETAAIIAVYAALNNKDACEKKNNIG